MGEVVRLTLEGPGAELGGIPAGGVARLLGDFERAVARAAETRVTVTTSCRRRWAERGGGPGPRI